MKASVWIPFPLAALLALAGCGKRETQAEAGVRTQTLLVGSGAEPESLDPHGTTDYNILIALFEGLATLDERTMTPVPAVAERWEISPDGCVYTFYLRPTARWSSGDPVTAHDFAFAFQRILLPKLGAPSSYMLWPIKNAEAFNGGKLTNFAAVGVEVVDSTTLRLTLERPTAYLLALTTTVAWLPVHRATIEKSGRIDDRRSAWARPGNLVGNGAFTLAAWRPNDRIVVTKNPYYWDAAHNRLERIVFFPIESPYTEEHAFRAGQIHITYDLPSGKIAYYRDRESARFRIDPMLNPWFLMFNVTRAPLDNQKVRHALSLAVDRDAIVRAIYSDSRIPATQLTPPDCAGYTSRTQVPTDFAAARRLLAEAGFPGGRGLPALELLVGNTLEQPKVAEAIQEMWRRELGITVAVATLETKTKLQNAQRRDYAIVLRGYGAEFMDPAALLGVFITNSGQNWTGWGHPDYDRLIADAAQTLNPIHRFELFQQAEALLLEEAPIAPLYFDMWVHLIDPAVKNWHPSPLSNQRYQLVWLEN